MNPAEHSRVATYYDAMLPRFAHDHAGGNARLTAVKMKLGQMVNPGATILDLGCGTGITSYWMAQHGAKVTAVDISPALIQYAREHSTHKNIWYAVADITDIDFSVKEKYDGIVMVDVFEHIPISDSEALMGVISKHSHKDTWLFLNIPDERFQHAMRENVPERLQIHDEAWSLLELQELFRTVGFEIASIEIYGIDITYQYNSILFIRGEKMKELHGRFTGGL